MTAPAGPGFIEQQLPSWVQRVLYLGVGNGEGAALLNAHGLEVYAVGTPRDDLDGARLRLRNLIESDFPGPPLPFPPASFDAVILGNTLTHDQWPAEIIEAAAAYLSPDGSLFFEAPHSGYWRRRAGLWPLQGENLESIAQRLSETGLQCYRWWRLYDQVFMAAPCEDGAVLLPDVAIALAAGEDRGLAATVSHVIQAVRLEYRPLEHAQRLRERGQPGPAYDLLGQAPAAFFPEARSVARVAREMQACLLDLTDFAVLDRLTTAQPLFYSSLADDPALPEPYLCQARLWQELGDTDMARRILALGHFCSHSASLGERLSAFPRPAPSPLCEPAPTLHTAPPRLRVLLVLPARAHYGLDVLFDGLCEVLGEQQVVEWPWKPSLHGQAPADFTSYPCLFARDGAPRTDDDVFALLEDGYFDFVLIGHFELHTMPEAAQRLGRSLRRTPFYIVDQEDGAADYREHVLGVLGRRDMAGYFKREMLVAHDYGPGVWPLPFAYPAHRARITDAPRLQDVFWAGQRAAGMRRPYIELMEKELGRRFDAHLTPEAYSAALCGAHTGLNLFGLGFDTVRYWELPAHGCLLFSERSPLRIPDNFVDGESAVFFDEPASFLEKLRWIIASPADAARIADAGRQHFLTHHTHAERARQLLARILTAS